MHYLSVLLFPIFALLPLGRKYVSRKVFFLCAGVIVVLSAACLVFGPGYFRLLETAVAAAAGIVSGFILSVPAGLCVLRQRKELLNVLLEFGHSGSVTRNIDQIILYATKLNQASNPDEYTQRRLLESWNIFTSYSKYSLDQVIRISGRSLYISESWKIQKVMRMILSDYCDVKKGALNVFKRQDRLLSLLSDLQHELKALEISADSFFSCDLRKILHQVKEQKKDELRAQKVELSEIEFVKKERFIVKADQNELLQILNQLIENSVYFMKESSKKWIQIEVDSLQTRVYIRITDTGAGFEENVWEKLFYPGYRDREGKDLNLYYVAQILARYKGNIEIESSGIGRGTTILIILRIPEKYV